MSIYVKNWIQGQRSYVVGLGDGRTEKKAYNRAPFEIEFKVVCDTPKYLDHLKLALDLLAKDGDKATEVIERMAMRDELQLSIDEIAIIKNKHRAEYGEDIDRGDINAIWLEL